MMKTFARTILGAIFLLGTVACGTSYELPEPESVHRQQAAQMFAKGRASPPVRELSNAAAERRFHRVAARVKPVAEKYCEQLTTHRVDVFCEGDLDIERELEVNNAFLVQLQHPVTKETFSFVRLTLPLLKSTANDDEVAFIISHEYGHLIGRHTRKKENQAFIGAMMAVPFGAVDLGAHAGSLAFTKEFELEADALGVRIAQAAGYDPIKGAQNLARPIPGVDLEEGPSFIETHPLDVDRLATILAAAEQIKAGIVPEKKNLF